MSKPNFVDVRNLRRLILARRVGISDHGRDEWHKLLQRELAKVDKELKPKDERVRILFAIRQALIVEIAAVVNEAELTPGKQ